MGPNDVIRAFDECREYVFGYSLGRDNPHASDKSTATRWISDGLTLTVAVIVFHEQMSWMHEKFLRYGHAKDKSYLPASLKVFDDNIETAIRKAKNGGQAEFWESEIAKWRSRCKSWFKKVGIWREDHWGPEPFTNGCRVPQQVLAEFRRNLDS